MRKLIGAILLTALVGLGQTAKFPTSIATTQDLLVAKDRSSSLLASGINASTLSVPVLDGAQFVAYEVITIDSEQMQICSIAGDTLTICSGTRGFNSTIAAAHSTSAAVRGQIVSWHFNVLSAEVRAIQTALGANLANVATTSDLATKADVSHTHAGSDVVSGAVAPAYGGTGTDASASTGFMRFTAGVGSISPFANSDLPAAFDVSGKDSTSPNKAGTSLPATCTVAQTFHKTDAVDGENLYLCTTTNNWTQVVGSGGGGTTYSVNAYTETFSSQTSVTISHNFGSTKQIILCANASGVKIEPDDVTAGSATSVVTFETAQSGACTVVGGSGLYEESFSSQTALTLDHDYNTQNIMVMCWDGSDKWVEPDDITATDADNADVTFETAQSGRCDVAAALGGGGAGAGVSSVGLSGTAEMTISNTPITGSGTMGISWQSQSANRFLASPSSAAGILSARLLTYTDMVAGSVLPDLTGNALKPIRANAGGTALEFYTPSTGGGSGTVTAMRGSATLNSWGTIAAHSCVTKNFSLPGALDGDSIAMIVPSSLNSGLGIRMSATTDIVLVELCNYTASGILVTDGKTFGADILRSEE